MHFTSVLVLFLPCGNLVLISVVGGIDSIDPDPNLKLSGHNDVKQAFRERFWIVSRSSRLLVLVSQQ